MSTGLRSTFWLHAVVASVFGLAYLFFPSIVVDLFELEPGDPIVLRLLGVTTLALGISSVLAALTHNLERAQIVLEMEVAYTIMATAVCLVTILIGGVAPILWVGVALFGIFMLLFGYFFLQSRMSHRVEPGQPALR